MKTIKNFGLSITALLLAVGIMSCEKENEQTISNETLTAKYTYRLSVNPTFLSLADIIITTETVEGKNTITMNDTTYLFNYNASEFPSTIKASVTYNWKKDLDTTSLDEVDLIMTSKYYISSYKQDKRIKEQWKNGVSIYHLGVKATNLEKIHQNHLNTFDRSNYTVRITEENNNLNFIFEN